MSSVWVNFDRNTHHDAPLRSSAQGFSITRPHLKDQNYAHLQAESRLVVPLTPVGYSGVPGVRGVTV